MERAESEGTYVTDWASAEVAVAKAMKGMGYENVRLTATGKDGGLDVRAKGAVAQVKHQTAKVPRPDIQKLKGAARGQKALFFAYGTKPYTRDAFIWATQNDVKLFTLDRFGEVRHVNDGVR